MSGKLSLMIKLTIEEISIERSTEPITGIKISNINTTGKTRLLHYTLYFTYNLWQFGVTKDHINVRLCFVLQVDQWVQPSSHDIGETSEKKRGSTTELENASTKDTAPLQKDEVLGMNYLNFPHRTKLRAEILNLTIYVL